VKKGIEEGRRADLIGGRPIRSMGGSSEVKRLRERQERIKGDERIFGDSAFVMEVLESSDEQVEDSIIVTWPFR